MATEILTTKLYKELELRAKKDFDAKRAVNKILELTGKVSIILSKIPYDFPNYTQHDIKHSCRIADHMYDLLPQSINKYNNTEFFLMLASAALHDVGMASPETYPSEISKTQNEKRKEHHIVSEQYILGEQISLRDEDFQIYDGKQLSLRNEVAKLARSHGESISWVRGNLKPSQTFNNDTVNLQFIAYLLRIADLLDFDFNRVPDSLHHFLQLPELSKVEWEKQEVITNTSKISKEGKTKYIHFDGSCNKPNVFRGLCNYFDYIESEINNIKDSAFSDKKYNILIDSKIHNNIEKVGFDSADLQLKMDYKSIANILMGENLYPDKKCALRELIQNSIDACLLRKKLERNPDSYKPEIKIEIDDGMIRCSDCSIMVKSLGKVVIEDNGIGMSEQHINNYFLNIGHSYYSSNEFREKNIDYTPISHYGIGFLASFMLSDRVTVITSDWENQMQNIELQLQKDDRYVVLKKNKNTVPDAGTKICLEFRPYFRLYFKTIEEIKDYIEDTFMDTGVQIKLIWHSYDGTRSESVEYKDFHIGSASYIDISKYLRNVDCKLRILIYPKVFLLNDFIGENYLLDSTISDEPMDGQDFYNYCKNTNTYYAITKLENDSHSIPIVSFTLLDDEASDFYDKAMEVYENDSDAWEKTLDKFPQLNEYYKIFVKELDDYWQIETEIVSSYELENPEYGKELVFNAIQKIMQMNHLEDDYDKIRIELNYEAFFSNEDYFSFIDSHHALNYRSIVSIKNVLIQNYDIKLPVLLNLSTPYDCIINIMSNNCFPDVTRTNLQPESAKKLGYALGRAFYMYFYNEELKDKNGKPLYKSAEKQFLKDFIDKYYPYDENNEFCKD